MVNNYEKLSNGVIRQIEKEPYNYGFDYSNNYNNLGDLGIKMGYLRLGFIIGAIGKVPTNLIDIGYGNGDFLKAASGIIQDCYGSDVSQNYPLPEDCKYVDDIYSKKFEVICMFDVLEHFNDIYEINNLDCNYLVVSLPNCEYLSDEWFDNWKHRKPNEHLWHFNKESLINFMKEVNFECVSITNLEDTIRKNEDASKLGYSNILTAIFKKL
jgi:hypothetical protein